MINLFSPDAEGGKSQSDLSLHRESKRYGSPSPVGCPGTHLESRA